MAMAQLAPAQQSAALVNMPTGTTSLSEQRARAALGSAADNQYIKQRTEQMAYDGRLCHCAHFVILVAGRALHFVVIYRLCFRDTRTFFLYLMRIKQCFARTLGLIWCHGHMPELQRTAEIQH
jgi:hypothetical protein